MFKLQRLEITGFKSFADYTEIVFTGKGITAVVGPNGCGKSNVSDAMSWVLGEQSAKSLRGEDMKDVIFQGTSKRKPSGMSEVVLHMVRDDMEFASDESELEDIDEKLGELDENAVDVDTIEAEHLDEENDDEILLAESVETVEEVEEEKAQAAQVGSIQTIQTKIKTKAKRRWRPRKFALDFAPGEAISVTRRLYLSGESEYLLNDKTCRLRDIQDLFSGTGLTGSNYAIIEQGRIGQILSSKPSNRRGLIEEAAGISKFRKRQRAAETRLESAKNNLSRISDIVSEIEKRTRSLRRQANKTQRYKFLREELRELLKQSYAAEGRHLSDSLDALEGKLEQATKIEREILEKVAEKDEAFRKATHDARFAEENLTEVRAKHSENTLKRDRVEREFRYQKEQIEELESRSNVLDAEVKVTNERIRLLGNEISRLEKEETKERDTAEKEQSILLEAETKYREKLDGLREIETVLDSEREDHLLHTAAVERLAEVGRQFEANLEKLAERIEGLRRESERAEEVFSARKKESGSLEKGVSDEREKLENLNSERKGLVDDVNFTREKLKNEEDTLREIRDKYSHQKHRLETLRELDEKRAIYAPSVQRLFAERKKIGVEFLGTLADKFQVGEKAENVIENLFGTFLQTVLVKNQSDAKKVARYVNKNNLGRIPILIADENQMSSDRDSVEGDSIAAFLGISGKFSKTLSNIFPREMSARVIDSLDKVQPNSSEILVTLDGDLVIGGKLYISGNANDKAKNASLLSFKRELRSLAQVYKTSSQDLEKATKSTNDVRGELVVKEDKLVDLQAFIVKVERELLSQEIQAKSLIQEIERAERHKKVVADEISQIEVEIKHIKKRREESGKNAQTAEKARVLSIEKIERISGEMAVARSVVDEENEVLSEKRTHAKVAAERKRSTQNTLGRLTTEKTELDDRVSRQNLENEGNKKRVVEIGELNEGLKLKIASTEEETLQEEVELKESVAHLRVSREGADFMSTELAGLNKKSAMARDERAGFEVNQTEVVTRLKNLNDKCSQDLNSRLTELVETVELPEDINVVDLRDEAEGLRQKLDNFGAINMLALEELTETEERLEFLSSQQQDVIDGISAAEEALMEIKKRSRQKFQDAFEAINKNFTVFFRELFGGGQGEMTLLEADDILESGIEIVAQPPGKRLQNMLLLSGGEKAMTAIALVLAIFKYRPSPFCLLDEVDAPLDDANVGRFVNKIADMSEKTQFIVITHNKRTMEAAKALYGVTMQEAGVSKMVSVRFD